MNNLRTKYMLHSLFGDVVKIGGKNLNENALKSSSKSTKIATIESNFSKIFRGGMPPDPLQPLLLLTFLRFLCLNSNDNAIIDFLCLLLCEKRFQKNLKH